MSTQHDVESRTADDRPGWGPTVTGGRRRRWWWWLLIPAILVLLLAAYGVGTALYASGQIERIPVEGLERGGPMNILVVGSDSREELTPEEQAELTTGDVGGERTDTIFLLTVDGGRAAVLAFPRDLFVTRCDGTQGRINAAQGIGGPGCLAQTVTQLSGIPIDHYVAVSFLGFRDIVDAVGGVRLCLEEAIQDPFAGVDLPAGCQTLSGREALGFVRTRKIDNDLERIKRQQRFLAALAGRLTSPGTLLNPTRTIRTAGKIGEALTADEGLGVVDLARLGYGARGLATGSGITTTVPVTPRNVGGAAVLMPVEGEAAALFEEFRTGAIFQRAGAGAQQTDAPVTVVNAARIGGLAAATADVLRDRGWQIADLANAEARDRSVIRHPPELADAAAALAGDLPVDVPLEEVAGIPGLELVLGRDAAPLAD